MDARRYCHGIPGCHWDLQQYEAQSKTQYEAKCAAQVEDLLREAMVLKEALDQAVSASVLERLLPKRYKQYQKGISQRS